MLSYRGQVPSWTIISLLVLVQSRRGKMKARIEISDISADISADISDIGLYRSDF